MYNCQYCNREFKDNGNRTKHEKYYCKYNSLKVESPSIKVKCKYCNKLYTSGGLTNHENQCKANPNRKINNYIPWNKGLTKETNETIRIQAEKFSKRVLAGEILGAAGLKGDLNPSTRPEIKAKVSAKMKGNHHNNPNRTGRGKKGYYKDFFCSSTYELAFVIYCLDHNIEIKRYEGYYNYEYNGEIHRYYPDFIIKDCIYEIKGYHSEEVDTKTNSVKDRPIKVLYRTDLAKVFEYIFNTYNKKVDVNLHELYDIEYK